MFFNIKVFYIFVFGAKLRKYFDMCKFFCTFVPFFSKKAKKMAKLLIIDDERGIRNTLREILADEGYEVEVAEKERQTRSGDGAGKGLRPDFLGYQDAGDGWYGGAYYAKGTK